MSDHQIYVIPLAGLPVSLGNSYHARCSACDWTTDGRFNSFDGSVWQQAHLEATGVGVSLRPIVTVHPPKPRRRATDRPRKLFPYTWHLKWLRKLDAAALFAIDILRLRLRRNQLRREAEFYAGVVEGLQMEIKKPPLGHVSIPVGSIPPWMKYAGRHMDKGDLKFYLFKDTSEYDYDQGKEVSPPEPEDDLIR